MIVQKESKPGWRTTEFWLTVLATVSAGLIAFGAVPVPDGVPKWVTYVAGVASVIGYAIARGLAKFGVPMETLVVEHRDPPEQA